MLNIRVRGCNGTEHGPGKDKSSQQEAHGEIAEGRVDREQGQQMRNARIYLCLFTSTLAVRRTALVVHPCTAFRRSIGCTEE